MSTAVDPFLRDHVDTNEIVDVTDYYQGIYGTAYEENSPAGVAKAERRGRNVLVLFRTGGWVQSIDGTRAKHKIWHPWLSSPQADLCEVQGSTTIITGKPDLGEPLFHQFQLF